MVVVGKTERTAKRNIIYPLMELVPGAVDYKEGSGEVHIFGRRCYVVGANDIRAENKIRGMTLAGGYVNEWTLIPEEFTSQLEDRCSIDGAQLLGDTNPDSPFHYLKKKIDGLSCPDLKSWGFKLDDNPVLSNEYKTRLRRIHAGSPLWLARMVDGKWAAAEGSVYPMLDVDPGGPHVVRGLPRWFERVVIGIDYATSTTTVFLAAGLFRGTWYVFSEWTHNAESVGRQLSDPEQSRAFRDWIEGLGVSPESIEVDPAASSFKKQLRDDGVNGLRDANNAVVDGIRSVSTALTTGLLKIHESCEGLLVSMSNYSWDPVAQSKGEDKPIKKHDHHADACRYICMRVMRFGGPATSSRDLDGHDSFGGF